MDFRTLLDVLEKEGDLIRIRDLISIEYEAAAICRQVADADGPALLIENVEGCMCPLAANVFGTRRRLARSLGQTEVNLASFLKAKLVNRVSPVRFSGPSPRCQEVVLTGADIDVTRLPAPLWNVGDAGRYSTSSLFVASHPMLGRNVSYHRCQLYGPTELGISAAPDHQLGVTLDEARAAGQQVQAAILLGARPSISIAAGSDFAAGDDEIAIAGALEGAAIPLVRCRTIDVDVPEDTEIVIEGFFTGEKRPEGPFVEFTGAQSPQKIGPVFTITCITHRTNPIFQGTYAGKPPSETHVVWRELEEVESLAILQRRYPMLIGLHRYVETCRDFMCALQVKSDLVRPGFVMNLMLATAAVMPRLKYVIAVDEDIDIYRLSDVLYALATRCDPKGDLAMISGTSTARSDPSSGGLTGKVFFDATKKESFKGALPQYPEHAIARAQQILAPLLSKVRVDEVASTISGFDGSASF